MSKENLTTLDLDKKYRIVMDPHCFYLEELKETTNKKTKEKKMVYRMVGGYHGKLSLLLHEMKNKRISQCETIKELKSVMTDIEEIIETATEFFYSTSTDIPIKLVEKKVYIERTVYLDKKKKVTKITKKRVADPNKKPEAKKEKKVDEEKARFF